MTFPRPTMLDLSRRTDVSRTEKGCPLLVMLEDEKGKGWYKWDWGTFIGLLETKQQHIIIHISMQGRRYIPSCLIVVFFFLFTWMFAAGSSGQTKCIINMRQ